MSFYDIATEVGIILLRCVMHPPHLGGTQYVGPKKVTNVTVFGYGGRLRGGRRPLTALSLGGGGASANVTF